MTVFYCRYSLSRDKSQLPQRVGHPTVTVIVIITMCYYTDSKINDMKNLKTVGQAVGQVVKK